MESSNKDNPARTRETHVGDSLPAAQNAEATPRPVPTVPSRAEEDAAKTTSETTTSPTPTAPAPTAPKK